LVLIGLISFFGSSVARSAGCDDHKGKLIFEDSFTNDTGGWTKDPDAKTTISGGTYAIHVDPQYTSWRNLNGTFNASDADYCMEVVMPKAVAPDNPVWVGLAFWATDRDNFFEVDLNSSGEASFGRTTAGKWSMIASLTDPGVKLDPGSVAAIRVLAAGGLISPSINGIALKEIRAQMPSGPLKFGIFIQTDKENPGINVDVKKFWVTDGK
jgi:hypothetical protein